KLRLSQQELANRLGVSFATVNRWENNKTNPSKLGRAQFEDFCRKIDQGQSRSRNVPAGYLKR
ncbi:MAG: helix-turn-helix transcriptional regulator, partial [Syntrophobacteraceae bacterium]